MKGQLKKIFGNPTSLENVSHMPSVKVEPVLQVNEREEGILFNRNFLCRGRGNFQGAVKAELQCQNKLISSERPFKILQNETTIIKIGQAVLEIFNFKD